MKLVCHTLDGHPLTITPAPVERGWMDATPQRFAYRCLPLNIANAHGWDIACPVAFSAIWDGTDGKTAIRIRAEEADVPAARLPVSHFGSGVLTFHVNAVFRTEPGLALWVGGPVNRPKDAIAALTGIVETDWAHQSFTMNWKFTRAKTPVRFAAGEPFCTVFPLDLGLVERTEPVFRPLRDDPELEARHKEWGASRQSFITDLRRKEETAVEAGWQRDYFKGRVGESETAPGHRTRLRLRPFTGAGQGG